MLNSYRERTVETAVVTKTIKKPVMVSRELAVLTGVVATSANPAGLTEVYHQGLPVLSLLTMTMQRVRMVRTRAMTNREVPPPVATAGTTEDTIVHVATRIKIRKRRTMLRMTRHLVDVARHPEVVVEEVVAQGRVEVPTEVRNRPIRTAMASRMAVLMMQRLKSCFKVLVEVIL